MRASWLPALLVPAFLSLHPDAALSKCYLIDPSLSTIPESIPISPDGSLTYTVTIRCPDGPPGFAVCVAVVFTAGAENLLCWCDPPAPSNSCVSNPPPVHSYKAQTDENGVATFAIRGSGCLEIGDPAIPGPDKFAARVYVDGVEFARCGVVSPDFVDGAGRTATDTPAWNPAGTCDTGLSDATAFTPPLATNTYQWCADLNGDDAVGLTDATILTPMLAGGASCAEMP